MSQKIHLVEVTSEVGAGTRGSSLGVGAIKVAAQNTKDDIFTRYIRHIIPNKNEHLWDEIETSKAKRIKYLIEEFELIVDKIEHLLRENHFPFVIAGDHSTAAASIAGIKKANPNKRLGVIWIDAHADLHSPYTTPSGNMHGMPLAIAAKEDSLNYKTNELDKETIELWEELKSFGVKDKNIDLKDIVFIGVRDTEEEENNIIERENIKNFTVKELREKTSKKVAHETLEILKNCDLIYISFDVDSLDPTISLGTGTPVQNGLFIPEALELVSELCKTEKIVCFEIVEVNPCLDNKGNVMAETALKVINTSIKAIENR